MKMRAATHRARVISSDEAASFVSSGMWLDYGTSLCQPDVFDKALAARAAELQNVKIRSYLSMKPRAVLEADLEGEHFFWFSLHFSGYDRRNMMRSVAITCRSILVKSLTIIAFH